MTSDSIDIQSAGRRAAEEFLAADALALADELSGALLGIWSRVGDLRRRLSPCDALLGDFAAIEFACARAVHLARRASEAIVDQGGPRAHAAAASMVRELGRLLVASLPDDVGCVVQVRSEPALVAMHPSELRRVLAGVVRGALHGNRAGDLLLEVADAGATHAPMVRIVLCRSRLSPATAADAADSVRELVGACGGDVQACATPGGGAAVVVTLPSPC
ncbi:MAG TPA: hypothetical protein VKU41_01550 [Polyangiaceae bacterium]|nr:hypothetical protein [Polyangiaceae bacterium]